MEITLCLRGTAKFDCGGKVYTLMPGTAFASLPEDVHRLRMNQRGARLGWLFLRFPERGQPILGLSVGETAYLIRKLRNMPRKLFPTNDDMRCSFLDFFEDYDLRGEVKFGRSLALRVLILRMLMAIVKCSNKSSEICCDHIFTNLINRIRRSPEKDYGVDALVAETRLSPNTILARFRKLTGLPPQAFVKKCRIRRAMDLLAKTDCMITEIASELGFASSQHFATRFRQETGISPKAWREKSRAIEVTR